MGNQMRSPLKEKETNHSSNISLDKPVKKKFNKYPREKCIKEKYHLKNDVLNDLDSIFLIP